jgi:hypothetical protein
MVNSGGGIIMFDCLKSYHQVFVQGCLLTEKDKEVCEQRLYSYLEVFEPNAEIKKCITISFVPVVANPLKVNNLISEASYQGEEGLLRSG